MWARMAIFIKLVLQVHAPLRRLARLMECQEPIPCHTQIYSIILKSPQLPSSNNPIVSIKKSFFWLTKFLELFCFPFLLQRWRILGICALIAIFKNWRQIISFSSGGRKEDQLWTNIYNILLEIYLDGTKYLKLYMNGRICQS